MIEYVNLCILLTMFGSACYVYYRMKKFFYIIDNVWFGLLCLLQNEKVFLSDKYTNGFRNTRSVNYSLSPGVWQSFVTIRSCNHLMRIISTYVDNTKKSEIS